MIILLILKETAAVKKKQNLTLALKNVCLYAKEGAGTISLRNVNA